MLHVFHPQLFMSTGDLGPRSVRIALAFIMFSFAVRRGVGPAQGLGQDLVAQVETGPSVGSTLSVYPSASYYPDGVNWRLNQKHMFCYEANAFACCLPGMMLYWRPITQLVQAKATAVGLVANPSTTNIPALSRLNLLIFRGGLLAGAD